MASDVAFLLLGPLVVRAGSTVLPIPPGKQRALLAALLMRANQMVSRDELTEALWGSQPPRSARQTTGESRIRTVPDDLRQLEQQILTTDPVLAAPAPSVARTPAGPSPRMEASGAAAVPASLPPDLADFTGRARQVEQLTYLLGAAPDGRRHAAVTVTAVAGPGGVGKTALAVHAAHLVSGHFPAGQLYLDLRGSSRLPLAPADALARILRDLGTEPGAVPASEAERAARYRTVTAGKRLLLVLDDARDAAQVRPLLPGPGGSVLVTSRRTLPDLETAQMMELDIMSDEDSAALFASIAGADRAVAPLTEALSAHRESGFRLAEAFALVTLGFVDRQRKDYGQAVGYLLEAAAVFREIGDRMREHEARLELSGVHLELGEVEAAEREAAAVIAVSRELRNRSCEARALAVLGRAERARGDLAAARTHWIQAIAIFAQLGDTNGAAATRAELEPSELLKLMAQA